MNHFEHLITQYSYFGLMITLIGGIIGLPLPDEVLLTFIGYQVYLGKMSYLFSLGSAFAAAMIGISVSFVLGNRLGLPFLKSFGPKIYISEKKSSKPNAYFRNLGLFYCLWDILFLGLDTLPATLQEFPT